METALDLRRPRRAQSRRRSRRWRAPRRDWWAPDRTLSPFANASRSSACSCRPPSPTTHNTHTLRSPTTARVPPRCSISLSVRDHAVSHILRTQHTTHTHHTSPQTNKHRSRNSVPFYRHSSVHGLLATHCPRHALPLLRSPVGTLAFASAAANPGRRPPRRDPRNIFRQISSTVLPFLAAPFNYTTPRPLAQLRLLRSRLYGSLSSRVARRRHQPATHEHDDSTQTSSQRESHERE